MTTFTKKDKQYIYKSTVRQEYGLTPKMIDELGQPDKTCENPYYSCGFEASLYLISRVEAWVEANKERLARAQELRIKRSDAMK